jgi:hypothetical protein
MAAPAAAGLGRSRQEKSPRGARARFQNSKIIPQAEFHVQIITKKACPPRVAPRGGHSWNGQMFSFRMSHCIHGGTKKEKGRDTRNPMPHPVSQAPQTWLFRPTLMAAMATDMHRDMMIAMQEPKNKIWRILKKSTPFAFLCSQTKRRYGLFPSRKS